MAVRQLAGPFPIVDETSTPVPAGGRTSFAEVMWVPGFGYVALINQYAGLMTMDGVIASISNVFNLTPLVYDSVSTQMKTYTGSNEFIREKVCLCAIPVTDGYPLPTFHDGGGSFSYETADRRITLNSGGLVNCKPGGTLYNIPDTTAVCPWTTGGLLTFTLGPGRSSGEMFIGWVNGSNNLKCVFYDTTSRKFSSEVFVLGVTGVSVVWCSDYGVLLAVQGDGSGTPYTCSIYSLDVVPASITTPVVVSGRDTAGNIATWQVQVQGANGDFCIGVFVEWSVTGAGEILDIQSTTDDSGNATARVLYHTNDSGTSTLEASVTC